MHKFTVDTAHRMHYTAWVIVKVCTQTLNRNKVELSLFNDWEAIRIFIRFSQKYGIYGIRSTNY